MRNLFGNMSPARITFFGGLALLVCGVQYLIANVPQPLAPGPLVTVIPLLAMADFQLPFVLIALLSALVPVAVFWILGFGLFRGIARISLFSLIAILVLGCLHVAYLVSGWHWGIEFQGQSHVMITTVFSVAVFAVGATALLAASKRQSFALSFSALWLVCFWLGWFAFPYMGELP